MLARARSLVQDYTAKQLYPSALFWADKAFSLSGGDIEDLATLSQALYLCSDHQRAIHVLRSSPLLPHSPALKYLAAKCHAACKEWDEVLSLLQQPVDDLTLIEDEQLEPLECQTVGDVRGASLVLQGIAHEGLGNIHEATNYYRQALMTDVFCEEALERLCKHYFLSAEEEKALLSEMPFKQCSVEEEQMLRYLYQSKLRLGGKKIDSSKVHESLKPLCDNPDVLCSKADQHFQSMNIESCYRITKEIVLKDPYHNSALLLHIACCVHKERVEELFALAQRLVNYFPQSPLSWHAVGCYYLTIKNHQNLRKYLTKAVSLDPHFAPAHMAFGLSFAMEGEHDQAIAAFSNAARVMKGSHLPLMHLGMEYYLTGSTPTATRFMKSALALSPHDPALLQETAVMLANQGSYEKAEKYLRLAVNCLQSVDPLVTLPTWEPVYNNLGHVYRKQKKYDLALEAHQRSLQLAPNKPSSLTAVAFTYLLKGDFSRSVEYCNTSLRLKREDQFTLELLRLSMEELAAQPLPVDVAVETLDSLELGVQSVETRRSVLGDVVTQSSENDAMIVE